MNDKPSKSSQPSGSPDTSTKTSKSRWPLITTAVVVVLAVVAGTAIIVNKQKQENAEAEKAAIAQAAQEACETAALDQVARYFRVDLDGTPLYFTSDEADSVEVTDGSRATVDASGYFSGNLASSSDQVPYRCTFSYTATGSGKDITVSSAKVISMMMDGADFESLTRIDEELEAQEEEAEAEAEREREEEEKRREQERRERRAEQERQAEQQQREEQARAQREQQQSQQQQQQHNQQQSQQQQQQAPAPAAPQQQAPSMEWATLGPYGGFMGCSQAQSMWPSNSTECYQGGDGNYYFNGQRQAMR